MSVEHLYACFSRAMNSIRVRAGAARAAAARHRSAHLRRVGPSTRASYSARHDSGAKDGCRSLTWSSTVTLIENAGPLPVTR
ncbi:hypothetical protein [Nonomuraea sp. CA-141351]|uniref:hypothetical protein n=1 Tax=Nonomuraea sp. CA-141351 TaxID=3239996 RepID=UPI003D8F3482